MLIEKQNRGANSGEQVAHGHDPDLDTDEGQDELIATAATIGVVGAGVLIFEAALLPGLVLGIVTMMVPKYLPKLSSAMNPLMKSTVRGAYKMGQKTKENVRRGAGARPGYRRRGRRRGRQESSPAHQSARTLQGDPRRLRRVADLPPDGRAAET
jgi:hypothetical protein